MVGPAGRVREALAGSPATLRVLAALLVLCLGGLLAVVVWLTPHGDPADRADSGGDLVQVGVVPGESVSAYLRGARDELTRLSDPSAPVAGDTWALVSLRTYVVPATLPATLDGVSTSEVYAHVPNPAARTSIVRIPVFALPADVSAGMLDAALRSDQEQAEYLKLSRAVEGDGADSERARRAYGEAAATAAAEAAAYRSGCACVFAAVVRGTPAALTGLAGRPGVRAVDPAPEIRALDRTEFLPPLPEQPGSADDPPPRGSPVPTESPAIASQGAAPLLSSAVTSTSSDVRPTVLSDLSATVTDQNREPASVPDTSAAQER